MRKEYQSNIRRDGTVVGAMVLVEMSEQKKAKSKDHRLYDFIYKKCPA